MDVHGCMGVQEAQAPSIAVAQNVVANGSLVPPIADGFLIRHDTNMAKIRSTRRLPRLLIAGSFGIVAVLGLFTILAVILEPRPMVLEAPPPIPETTNAPTEKDESLDQAVEQTVENIYRQLINEQYNAFFELVQLHEEKRERFVTLIARSFTTSTALYQSASGAPLHAEVLHDAQNQWAAAFIAEMRDLLGHYYPWGLAYADSLSERDLVRHLRLDLDDATQEKLISSLIDERKFGKCSASGRYEGKHDARKACLQASNARILGRASLFLTPAQLKSLERWALGRLIGDVP